MEVCNHAVFENDRALRKHRNKHRGKHEKIVRRNGKVIRYFSGSPNVAKGEAIRDLIKEQGDISLLVFLEKLEASSLWYVCSFDNDGVIAEDIRDLDSILHKFGFDLHHASRVLIAGTSTDDFREFEDKCVEVSPLTEEQLKPYALSETKALPKRSITLICLAVLGMVVSWCLFQGDEEPPKVQMPKVTAKELFLAAYSSKTSASEALKISTSMLLEASLMPEGMKANKVVVENDKVTMLVHLGKVRDIVVRRWFKKHRNMNQLYDKNSNLIQLDLDSSLVWSKSNTSRLARSVVDALELIGAEISKTNSISHEDIGVDTYELSFKGSVGQLSLMAQILASPSITLNSLTLEMNSEYQVTNCKMSFDIQGVILDENTNI
ncbi:hypothetical protein [Vibrio coralliilyticus]|uniref:hypothetical protein n=1 Tax=Vibrio coralliilyticus TaxID=190893 RepID=UPI000C16F76B|nr:hypothetical protein [Vibrio coralliilyticus]